MFFFVLFFFGGGGGAWGLGLFLQVPHKNNERRLQTLVVSSIRLKIDNQVLERPRVNSRLSIAGCLASFGRGFVSILSRLPGRLLRFVTRDIRKGTVPAGLCGNRLGSGSGLALKIRRDRRWQESRRLWRGHPGLSDGFRSGSAEKEAFRCSQKGTLHGSDVGGARCRKGSRETESSQNLAFACM